MNKDLLFVSGKFFEHELPPDKKYLFRYFRTEIQKTFVRYFLLFGTYDNFVDHTGCHCTDKWLKKLAGRLETIEAIKQQARKDFDLSLLSQIEAGEYPI